MTSHSWLWVLAGVLVGELHARSLWRSARAGSAWQAPLRFLGVGGFLVAAALCHELVAALGWFTGFGVGVVLRARRGSAR